MLAGLAGMGNSNFISDDFKEFLWDNADMDLYSSLSGWTLAYACCI